MQIPPDLLLFEKPSPRPRADPRSAGVPFRRKIEGRKAFFLKKEAKTFATRGAR
jgi:hypothetical protein